MRMSWIENQSKGIKSVCVRVSVCGVDIVVVVCVRACAL